MNKLTSPINSKSEAGSFLIWLAISIMLVLTTLGYLYFNNARLTAYTHLQSIAEAAAIAGARQLCPQDECLTNAYRAALTTINHNFSIQKHAYKKISLNSLPDASTERKRFRSDDGNDLEVVIYHGWTRRDDPSTTTEIWEEVNSDWQAINPGIPAPLVINTLVVEISLRGITSVVGFEVGNSDSALIKAQSAARSGPVNNVPIAPFAIPACALLNEAGTFNPADLCYGDRMFTRSDRYLPDVNEFLPFSVSYKEALEGVGPYERPTSGVADDYLSDYNYLNAADAELKREEAFKQNKFGVRPSFFYGPCSNDINECNIKRQLNYSLDRDNINYNDEYATFGGWSNYAYSHISDHFGVVGYVTNVQNENQLQLTFNKILHSGMDKDNTAIIGQEFKILHKGLQDLGTGNLIWEIIVNQGNASYFFGDLTKLNNEITMSSNRTMGMTPLTNFPNLELLPDRPLPYDLIPATNKTGANYSATKDFISPSEIFFNEARLEGNDPATINTNRYPTLLRDQFSNGLCSSRRVALACNGYDIISNPAKLYQCLSDPKNHFESGKFDVSKQQEFADYTGQTFALHTQLKDSSKDNQVWKTKVPIIGEVGPNARSCLGANHAKPAIDPHGQYQIIGFVDVDIFDLDIGGTMTGQEAPAIQKYDLLGPSGLPVPTANPDISNPDYHDYHLKHYPVSSSLKIPEVPFDLDPTTPESHGPNPWSFQVDNIPTACNMVRARIACNNNFIASSQNYGPRKAQLINNVVFRSLEDAS